MKTLSRAPWKAIVPSFLLVAALVLGISSSQESFAQGTPGNLGGATRIGLDNGTVVQQIVFPDNTVGSVTIARLGSYHKMIAMTIPDETGHGMKTQVQFFSQLNGVVTAYTPEVFAFTNP